MSASGYAVGNGKTFNLLVSFIKEVDYLGEDNYASKQAHSIRSTTNQKFEEKK
jgi:hypothetical protein